MRGWGATADPAVEAGPDRRARPAGDRRGVVGFLQGVYRLDTGPWLPPLINRPGWHQYVAREQGGIVAARGMYVGADGIAWLGMDGPVPGIMSRLRARRRDLRGDCGRRPGLGARTIIADIEQPSAGLDTPSYADFAALGFSRPYTRTHWARV